MITCCVITHIIGYPIKICQVQNARHGSQSLHFNPSRYRIRHLWRAHHGGQVSLFPIQFEMPYYQMRGEGELPPAHVLHFNAKFWTEVCVLDNHTKFRFSKWIHSMAVKKSCGSSKGQIKAAVLPEITFSHNLLLLLTLFELTHLRFTRSHLKSSTATQLLDAQDKMSSENKIASASSAAKLGLKVG